MGTENLGSRMDKRPRRFTLTSVAPSYLSNKKSPENVKNKKKIQRVDFFYGYILDCKIAALTNFAKRRKLLPASDETAASGNAVTFARHLGPFDDGLRKNR